MLTMITSLLLNSGRFDHPTADRSAGELRAQGCLVFEDFEPCPG